MIEFLPLMSPNVGRLDKPDDSISGWVIFVIAFGPGILIYIYHLIRVKAWEQEILPLKKDDERYFINAYICAAVIMIKADTREGNTKRAVLRHTLSKQSYDTSELVETFDKVWKKEISLKRVSTWIKHRLSHQERNDLLYMLVELSLVDGVLLSKEMELLRNFSDHLNIPFKELKHMIASHKQRMARERSESDQRERERRKESTKVKSKSSKNRAFEILGVSPHASQDEIKKAYRNLVKKYHPDKYIGKEQSMIDMAQVRFIEIQQAYELLSM